MRTKDYMSSHIRKRKDLWDIIIHLQKTYHLYFIEFREAPNGRKSCILTHPNNKNWWIEILILNRRKIWIYAVQTGKNDEYKEQVRHDLINKKYKNAGQNYQEKWLRL